VSVNSEDHVLGLWIGGGVSPAALREIEAAIRLSLSMNDDIPPKVVTELHDMANACHAQLSKLPEPPKRDWRNLL
jgi:hypothetical protein